MNDSNIARTDVRLPSLGLGLGVRPEHYNALLNDRLGCVSWLEALTENYLIAGGRPLRYLEKLREHYPLVLHGVSLSIGSSDPLNRKYLEQVRTLADRFEAAWVSDHVCWTGVDGINLHDLLPLPYTESTLRHVTARILDVQDHLRRRIVLENVSSYLTYRHSEMSEWEFLQELAERADCLLLLDVNNVYVSSVNHGFDARAFLQGIPVRRVQQLHLAGHRALGALLVDTHDEPVSEAVWQLYEFAIARFGPLSTMIERDGNIPELDVLLAELTRARDIAARERAA